jgi:hypothetical protein
MHGGGPTGSGPAAGRAHSLAADRRPPGPAPPPSPPITQLLHTARLTQPLATPPFPSPQALCSQQVELVLTAHPTQAFRQSLLKKYAAVRRLMDKLHTQVGTGGRAGARGGGGGRCRHAPLGARWLARWHPAAAGTRPLLATRRWPAALHQARGHTRPCVERGMPPYEEAGSA